MSDASISEGTVTAADGVRIHYLAGGAGEPAVVFVHGWLGNAHWWDGQLGHFAPSRRVVAIDLAGHGQSGRERASWTVEAFAGDVAAVVEALGLARVVLVGHSMSGKIILEAARRLGGRVVALVPVDALHQPQEASTLDEDEKAMLASLRADFPARASGFLGQLFVAASPPAVVERVLAEARASPPDISVDMLEKNWPHPTVPALRSLKLPIRAINALATDVGASREYAPRFDVLPIHGVGHWPMLEAPQRFDALLERVLREVS